MRERLLVIGGDAAGMSAASQARKLRTVDDLEIVAFERGDFVSYSACGIPYFVGDVVRDLDALVVRTPEKHRERDIDVRMRHEVTAIDVGARRVTVRDLDAGAEYHEGFDQLMVATGAKPIVPEGAPEDARNMFGVQILGDGLAIRRAVEELQPNNALVIGGGYIGLEMAEAMIARDIKVAVIERAPQPMTTLDPDMGALIADAIRDMGIDLRTNESVEGFDVSDGRVTAVTTTSGRIPADIVILGIGVEPSVDVAEMAGIELGISGAIKVDRMMRTPTEGVWAAGDCAEKHHLVSRTGVAIPLGTHANKEGRVAGVNLGGGYMSFPGVIGTAASKICDQEVARTGLTEGEAEAAGFESVTATIESTTRAGYYPGAEKMTTKLIVENPSGRLLGAQIIGREGAAKRIDTLATALWNEMTVDALQHVDLSYAPPFSPVWDPVLIAARKAWAHIEEARAGPR
jgi:NADPH-dependent 2,4-dienoyl-CoA reductase/sulfur reductase-like enzyme